MASSSLLPITDTTRLDRSNLTDHQAEIWNYVFSRLKDLKLNPLYLFVSGPAGTGKSIVLAAVRNMINRFFSPDRAAIVSAPVGGAAANVNTTTIHSIFLFSYGRIGHFDKVTFDNKLKLRELLNGVRVLILDEISMVSNILLAELDYLLRIVLEIDAPFGGLSLIVFGDLLQLPPVRAPRVFEDLPADISAVRAEKCPNSTPNLWSLMELRELTENIRTRNPDESEVLEALRVGEPTPAIISKLQRMCSFTTSPRSLTPEDLFNKLDALESAHPTKNFAILVSNNEEVKNLNSWKLSRYGAVITINPKKYRTVPENTQNFREGVFEPINVAIGCKVMITQNFDVRSGIVNGAIGRLVSADSTEVVLRLPKAGIVRLTKSSYRDRDGKIFWEQFPIFTAEVSTVHRVQGLTFDGVIVSTIRIFGDGALYTALSRARSLSLCYITRFNVGKWDTSRMALNEYSRMRAQHAPAGAQLDPSERFLRLEMAAKDTIIQELRKKTPMLKKKYEQLKRRNAELQQDNVELEHNNAELGERNAQMTQRVGELEHFKRARQGAWECSICYREYSTTVIPRTLGCGHTFCSECIVNCVFVAVNGHNYLRCGKCRATIDLEEFNVLDVYRRNFDMTPDDIPPPLP